MLRSGAKYLVRGCSGAGAGQNQTLHWSHRHVPVPLFGFRVGGFTILLFSSKEQQDLTQHATVKQTRINSSHRKPCKFVPRFRDR